MPRTLKRETQKRVRRRVEKVVDLVVVVLAIGFGAIAVWLTYPDEGDRPAAVAIDTESCRIDRFVVKHPSLYVDQGFSLAIHAEPPVNEPSIGECLATATLTGAEDAITFDRRTATAELGSEPFTWTGVPEVEGRHNIVLRVELASSCVRCRKAHSQHVQLVVDKDPALERMRQELERVASGIDVALQPDDPLRRGRQQRTTVVVGPPLMWPPGVDDTVIALRAVDGDETASLAQPLEPGSPAPAFEIVLKPDSTRDYDLTVGLALSAVWQGERLTVPVERVVAVDVQWRLDDFVMEHAEWSVAVGTAVVFIVGVLWRRCRRQGRPA